MVMQAIASGIFNLVGSQVSAPALTPTDFAFALRSESLFADRDAKYELYQHYYEGQQSDPRDITFGERQAATPRQFTHAHNYCARAIDVLVERLDITAITATGEGLSETQAQTLGDLAWGWWEASDGPELQNTVHAQAFVKGDAYVMVDYDAVNGRPRFTFHDGLTIAPDYDAYHHARAVYKYWSETWYDDQDRPHVRQRITKYTDSLIEKYANEGRGWVLWQGDLNSDGVSDGGIIPWLDAQGQPLGIPIIHFANRARGQDFGRSELADLIAAQDELNRRIWFTSEAMSYQGAQQVVLTNVQPPKDPLVRSPGTTWTLAAQNQQQAANVTVIPAGDVAALEAATEKQEMRFATLAAVPVHLLRMEGNPPSGESLKTAEAPLTGKAADRITTFTPPWTRAFTLALKLEQRFGAGVGALSDGVTLAPEWASVYTRTELTDAQRVAQLREDLPWVERMKMLGYAGDEIEAMRAVLEADGTSVPGASARAPAIQNAVSRPSDGQQPPEGDEVME